MARRLAICALACVVMGSPAAAPQSISPRVRIGVLGLFHPGKLGLEAAAEPLMVLAGSHEFILEPHSPSHSAEVVLTKEALRLEWNGQSVETKEIRVSGRDGKDVVLFVGIPGRIQRAYQGILEIRARGHEIVPIVSMDIEAAVAMAVAAETSEDTPAKALEAQAVVARSYFLAGKGRHSGFDFCDLTHCQLIRDVPGATSPAAVAASATRGLVLAFDGKPFAAMFSRSCGGETLTCARLGLHPADYPYFAVPCKVCAKRPHRWTRRLTAEDAVKLLGTGEAGRLAVNRLRGWKTVPSNNYTVQREGPEVVLRGSGEGHGLGLCQRGAEGMAAEGASFREILRHYFPNTTIVAGY